MTSKHIFNIFLIAILGLLLGSCRDDDIEWDDLGEGEGLLSASVTFQPLVGTLEDSSRTPGDAIKGFDTLTVLVYDSKGTLLHCYQKDQLLNYKYTADGNTEMPDDKLGTADGSQAESKTATADFTLPDKLPFGRYRIYAVANVPGITSDNAADIENIKRIQFDWNRTNIAANNRMFGYFTPAEGYTGDESNGFEAPLIVVNKENIAIHSWIKRMASKVTVAFDGSGLKDNVWVYIRKVTIHDIPKKCYLGADNTPTSRDQLYNPYDVVTPEPNTTMYYTSKELKPSANSGTAADPGDNYHNWMRVANGLGEKGVLGSDHSEKANALYFFENNQGDHQGDPKYDKRQNIDNVGTNITKPDQEDFQDNIPYGAYIEVEAYYVSENIANVSNGAIKYRFMLGKNTTYNYNAARNHHFKLTLGFKGWANQPDWHIEYYEPEPDGSAPSVFRVSYLYNQRSMLPIKLTGKCKSVEVKIIENNWSPCDSTGKAAPANVGGSGHGAFNWNTAAGKTYNGTKYPYLGFLALQVNSDGLNGYPKKNIIENMTFSQGTSALNALENYYNGTGNGGSVNQGYRKFSGADLNFGPHISGVWNSWQVNRIDNDSRMLLIPVFTRNKSMIVNSGYTGNNPYVAYYRKAIVQITMKFDIGGGKEKTIVKNVRVMQVPRIVNPKGVWRKWNDNRSFHVQLMQLPAPNASTFDKVESEGAWKAYVEASYGSKFVSLSTATGESTLKNDTIFGGTSSNVDFNINFAGVSKNTSACAIIRVMYHGDQCVHKILVRQGYAAPLRLSDSGALWSSYNVYSAKRIGSTAEVDADGNAKYNVVLTKNSLAVGSFFKRANFTRGIYNKNRETANLGPYQAPGSTKFACTDGKSYTWGNIGRRYDRDNFSRGLGTFTAEVDGKTRTYQVPSYEHFSELDSHEFAFGVMYGDGATFTQSSVANAYGLYDPGNSGNESPNGARGVIVYNLADGRQIFFPLGVAGIGRRRQFNTIDATYNGTLWYSDVNGVLGNNGNNQYRPIPYNLPASPGAIYWIDKNKEGGHMEANDKYPSMGWDFDYFSLNVSPYTQNNYNDACLTKLIVTKQ